MFKNIYGNDYVSSNIHNLTHVVDEVRKYGQLSNFNAYPFENKLYVIKNLIRQGNKPLQQVARRLNERLDLEIENSEQSQISYPFIKKSKNRSTPIQFCFKSFTLSGEDHNKWFLNNEGYVMKLETICTKKEGYNIYIHWLKI